ncbi:A/G-specific adenine glycosylase [Olivibacter sp. XZL3]|uniref:A/G-specific adenine glycosylase n=1 Tax=Olivibacter sp. XZL3 TaxID=1735116 RepID=UPI001066D4C9|nr:A/G-specific adenine glycosylase [Olivibacter sp. XZL3]
MLFAQEIVQWYHKHKRDLPWRSTTDPYIIWLSEIILQQTRVEQGLPYFHRFVATYPTVQDFANAEEDEILRLWQGLGYYSRARNMHKAAKTVIREHNGTFPKDYNSLLKLPGVGEYTAAAIASFSANEPQAVLDGNVFRVLARYFGIDEPINTNKGKKIFSGVATDMLDEKNASIYNQAVMEFGALQCKPQSPNCDICPLNTSCYARLENKVNFLPVKIKGKASKDRHFYYFILKDKDRIAMQRRGPKDIWENMYEFPLIEYPEALDLSQLKETSVFQQFFPVDSELEIISRPKKHVLSHQNIYATFIAVKNFIQSGEKKRDWNYVFIKDLDTLAKPKLIFTFLRDHNICNN